jgi:WD40 repeat protein
LRRHSSGIQSCYQTGYETRRHLHFPDLPHLALLRTLKGHSDSVNARAFSPNGKLTVTASDDQTLKVWYAETRNCLATFYADGAISACAMHGELIVAGGQRGVYFLKLVR